MMLCGGCRAAYLSRLAWEEVRYLGSASAATDMLATAENPEKRHALEVLIDVRRFAQQQGLNVGGSYRKVADAARASSFEVVTAAYADHLEPYTWWYPIIGDIPYRGYFDRPSAEEFAATLRAKGLETMIVEASAYSTLGWFDDPLPSSVLDRGETAVVLTVLHELTHQTFFAPGRVALNETLATATSWRLAESYFLSKGDQKHADAMAKARQTWIERSDLLDKASDRLKEFFDQSRKQKLAREAMLQQRQDIYADLLGNMEHSDPVFAEMLRTDGLNNASFLAAHRYSQDGRAIDAYLAAQPSIEKALARLNDAQAKRIDLRDVIAGTTAPKAK
ncbi:MAG TPA: aminopeptidase [Candidatus Binatia bacterium]|jgi:predicted aminopeptidase